MIKTRYMGRAELTKAVVFVGLLTVSLAAIAMGGCGGGACAELDSKKSECSKDGPNKELCEKGVAAAVQAANQDACKTMLDNMAKKK
jgi:uncharacterized ferredoxin-like protein